MKRLFKNKFFRTVSYLPLLLSMGKIASVSAQTPATDDQKLVEVGKAVFKDRSMPKPSAIVDVRMSSADASQTEKFVHDSAEKDKQIIVNTTGNSVLIRLDTGKGDVGEVFREVAVQAFMVRQALREDQISIALGNNFTNSDIIEKTGKPGTYLVFKCQFGKHEEHREPITVSLPGGASFASEQLITQDVVLCKDPKVIIIDEQDKPKGKTPGQTLTMNSGPQ